MASSAVSAASSNNNNMYRVGDYVFFESSGAGPFSIRRIEELNKTATGNVEARVMCFYRRNEIPTSLIPLADKHHWGDEPVDQDSDDEDEPPTKEKLERSQLKQREVFLSRQIETLPATLIRGKCSVTLLSEVETVTSYSSREDAFFYALVFDPNQKTLLADRGDIRIGSGYQATPLPPVNHANSLNSEDLEELIWSPESGLEDHQVDQFIIISRSVGTFARALDCSSSVKQPSLHMSAAAASRDITVFHAYRALQKHSYDIAAALASLVPSTGPVLCRDEMEDWSSSEANLFEEAIEKYGKDFNDIKKDFLPWKSMRNIIEYYFMWKTTDRYVQQKRIKAMEAESKLKQVYVPAYTRKSTRVTGPNGSVMVLGRDCDAYPTIPKYSWSQYKKYGRFSPASTTDDCFILDKSFNNTTAQRLAQLRPGLIIEPGSPSKASGKTRAAFFLRTAPLTRASRRVCENIVRLKHHARNPTKLIDMKVVRAEAVVKLSVGSKVRQLNRFLPKQRPPMSEIYKKLGQKDTRRQEWLVLTPKENIPLPEVEAFPRPKKSQTDGSYIYDRIPNVEPDQPKHAQMMFKKRPYDEKPSSAVLAVSPPLPPPAAKQQQLATRGVARGVDVAGTQARAYHVNQVAPKGKIATLTRVAGTTRTVISWQDAPDDLFYRAGGPTKKARKRLSMAAIRRAARKPFRRIM